VRFCILSFQVCKSKAQAETLHPSLRLNVELDPVRQQEWCLRHGLHARSNADLIASISDQLFKSTQPIKAPTESRRSQQHEVELEEPVSTTNDL